MIRAGWRMPALRFPLPLLGIVAGLVIAAAAPGLLARDTALAPAVAGANGQVEAAVRSHLYEWVPLLDPLITLEDGVQVKTSNVRGIEVGGARYFYRPVHSFSADPVREGRPGDYQLVLVMDAGTPFETEVYRVTR